MWHPSVVMRIILAILGVIALFVGVAAWSLETEYGGDSSVGAMEYLADGTVRVYEVDEQTTDEEGHPLQTLVFVGTEEEAEAWMARQDQRRNYVFPGLIVALGVGLLGAALVPSIPRADRRLSADDQP
jgi:hypothetical protein